MLFSLNIEGIYYNEEKKVEVYNKQTMSGK